MNNRFAHPRRVGSAEAPDSSTPAEPDHHIVDDAQIEAGAFILEQEQRLSQSLLWRVQRNYFEREGLDAWRTGAVPHYATNNPALASAMADVAIGYLRDFVAHPQNEPNQPFYIVELGTGCGRFGFLFLKMLLERIDRSSLRGLHVRYVMSDLVKSSLEFLARHPALESYYEAGVLEFALFDIEKDNELRLQPAGLTIQPGALINPLIVIANYVFDSIPQDAFSMRDAKLHECLLSLSSHEEAPDLSEPEHLSQLLLDYHHRPARPDYYPEPALNVALEECARNTPDQTAFLFPCTALRCLSRLQTFANGRLLVLTAGRNEVHERTQVAYTEPKLTLHGCISLPVNYQAIESWFHQQEGLPLQSRQRQFDLHCAAFVLGAHPHAHIETQYAYRAAFDGTSCSDFFRLRQGVQDHYKLLDVEHLLSVIRLSHYDPRILGDCVPALTALAPRCSPVQKQDLIQVVHQVWANYFHIGEERDLPFAYASLLYALGDDEGAGALFEASNALYGIHPRTLWNIGLCLLTMNRIAEAAELFRQARGFGIEFQTRPTVLPKDS